MRKGILVTMSVVLAAGAAFAAGSIISSFRSPFYPGYAKGMDHRGQYLYHVSNYRNYIYETTTTGSIVRSITAPRMTMGVYFTGSYFWTCSFSPAMVYYLTTTGSVVRSFAGPAYGYGLTYDGRYLWYSSAIADRIYRLTTTGSVVMSFSHPGTFAGGLDWANGYIWAADWPSSGSGVYRVTTTGSVVESYRPVPNGGRPSGCAWDGNYLWYVDYNSPRYVYQITTALTSIVPSSLGKIKSIYR
ncbi:MAG: hypothetical protein GTN49_13255 [candidate division Zixibacteria bacterium]|nr:hypothetical protein [candidate division Zixibacteria bacterium]